MNASRKDARQATKLAAEQREREVQQLEEFLTIEADRCQTRRDALFGSGTAQAVAHDRYSGGKWTVNAGNWALAFSGGGIRSATFNLGVLQGLATPTDHAASGLPPVTRSGLARLPGLLPHFDYVSSVSGGGFIAGFLHSLFAPKAGSMPAATDVYKHLAEEPPGRARGGFVPTPLAWLRENGRYLAPSGAGDMSYAVCMSIRNWMGVHLLFGAAIVLAYVLIELLAALVLWLSPGVPRSWWMPALAVLLAWMLPVAGAYWMTRDANGPKDTPSLPMARVAWVLGLGAITLLVGIAPWLDQRLGVWPQAMQSLRAVSGAWLLHVACFGLLLLLAVGWAWAIKRATPPHAKQADLSVMYTKAFKAGTWLFAVLLAVALVIDTAHWLVDSTPQHPVAASAGAGGVLAVAYRLLMKMAPALRGAGSSLGILRGAVRRSLAAVLGVVGALLAFGTAVFWTAAAYWLMIPCTRAWPAPQCSPDAAAAPENAVGLFILAGLVVLVAGRWPSFLNMSSYHYFYSARLARAYLGAANPCRTKVMPQTQRKPETIGATEPDEDDLLAYPDYHANPAAPLHLINITLNQTVDRSEQLLQRDRKGRPFVVLPDIGTPVPDKVQVSIGDRYEQVGGAGGKLGIADWLAVSGAAVSTGLGRQTSLGAALCVMFANARIGRWWPRDGTRDSGLRAWLPTYAYLFDELRGRFHGARPAYLYLTDGAHFENTATYELLRRVRHPSTRVRFILMCDCGADQAYHYDDLANLVRLARIDFGLEVEVDHAVARPPSALASVFGTPETMGPADAAQLDTRCAMLLNVRCQGALLARIVMIKPRLIACASSDVLGYYRNNPRFPQQRTGDQFFDEEQWESYRKLGLECCRAVLGLGAPLWECVLD